MRVSPYVRISLLSFVALTLCAVLTAEALEGPVIVRPPTVQHEVLALRREFGAQDTTMAPSPAPSGGDGVAVGGITASFDKGLGRITIDTLGAAGVAAAFIVLALLEFFLPTSDGKKVVADSSAELANILDEKMILDESPQTPKTGRTSPTAVVSSATASRPATGFQPPQVRPAANSPTPTGKEMSSGQAAPKPPPALKSLPPSQAAASSPASPQQTSTPKKGFFPPPANNNSGGSQVAARPSMTHVAPPPRRKQESYEVEMTDHLL